MIHYCLGLPRYRFSVCCEERANRGCFGAVGPFADGWWSPWVATGLESNARFIDGAALCSWKKALTGRLFGVARGRVGASSACGTEGRWEELMDDRKAPNRGIDELVAELNPWGALMDVWWWAPLQLYGSLKVPELMEEKLFICTYSILVKVYGVITIFGRYAIKLGIHNCYIQVDNQAEKINIRITVMRKRGRASMHWGGVSSG